MEVCGVDPGLGVTGYAVLAIDGAHVIIRDAGVCRTDEKMRLGDRLAQLEFDFSEIIEQWRPAVVGVEQLFSHYKHPRTAVLMGHARGIILLAAARRGVRVVDLSATQVKRYMTGNGRASKAQMQRAVTARLRLRQAPEPTDVSDALAIALCCGADVARVRPEAVAG
ncbi:MAG: crossover junction endodeoxyribonuclease RuvC [Phycisphaerales bacterium]|nr:crossover junction endodeoxyribonuclease RuvC [Phycisphaerales bacterium]